MFCDEILVQVLISENDEEKKQPHFSYRGNSLNFFTWMDFLSWGELEN